MRAIWTGSVSFGLVNIPVRMFSGSQAHDGIDLSMLHEDDLSPIRYARICRDDGEEVPWDEIVKGYEYKKGDYVVLEKEDFEKANVHKTKTLDIKQFVDATEIDLRYFDKPYYLEPAEGAEKPYALLREALEESGKVGLVKYAMRARDNIGALTSIGKALVLVQMRFPADVREANELKLPTKRSVDKDELKLAMAIIDQLTKKFTPGNWHDTYTEELEEIIEAKAKGRKPKKKGSEPKDTKVTDLMSTLKASLKKAS
jgi:DNA end-binding protein Ku